MSTKVVTSKSDGDSDDTNMFNVVAERKTDDHYDFPDITELPDDLDDITVDKLVEYAFSSNQLHALLYKSFGLYLYRISFDIEHFLFLLDSYKVLFPSEQITMRQQLILNRFIVAVYIRGREKAIIPINIAADMYANLEETVGSVDDVEDFLRDLRVARTEAKNLLKRHCLDWIVWIKNRVKQKQTTTNAAAGVRKQPHPKGQKSLASIRVVKEVNKSPSAGHQR